MQRRNKLIEKYISSQWGDFLELALLEIDKAFRVYKLNSLTTERNRFNERKVIAPSESAHSAFAIVSIAIALESFVSYRAFNERLDDFDSFQELALKLDKFNIHSTEILAAVRELTVCRDSIVHGHIWIKHRVSNNYTFKIEEIRSYLWSPFKNKRKKYIQNVNWTKRETKDIKLKIIPLDVSYIDCVKALKILTIIMEFILESASIQWRPPIFPYERDGFSSETAQALREQHHPSDWLSYYENNLIEVDKNKVIEIFNNITTL